MERLSSTSTSDPNRLEEIDRYARAHHQLATDGRATPLLETAISLRPPGAPIVDAGCGEGASLRSLRQWTVEPLLGCDLSEHRARRALVEAAVVVADCVQIPLRDRSVGLAVSRHVIEHVPDDHALAAELLRVLRPGGLAYLETPLRLAFAWYPYRNRAGRWVLDPTHVREYGSAGELETVLGDAGFEILGTEVDRIRYPAGHLVQRVRRRLGRHHDRGPGPADGLSVPIPRYREARVLARRPA